MHQIHAADALFLVARGVGKRHALLELARVDAAERDRADVLEAHDLEGDHATADRRRSACAGLRLAGLRIDARVGFAIGGRRQEVDDGVEQRLHALVLERRAAHHRIEGARDGRLADQLAQRVLVGLLALEVGFHGRRRPSRRRLRSWRRGIRRPCSLRSAGICPSIILASLPSPSQSEANHADEVDDAGEVAFGADRQLQRNRRWRRASP